MGRSVALEPEMVPPPRQHEGRIPVPGPGELAHQALVNVVGKAVGAGSRCWPEGSANGSDPRRKRPGDRQ